MTALPVTGSVFDNCVALFHQLTPAEQSQLIKELTQSKGIRGAYRLPEPENALSLEELAGSWEDDRSTEEIIQDIRQSRNVNRRTVDL